MTYVTYAPFTYMLHIPPKLPPQQIPIPTLPIHYDTFTELRWRLWGVTRWEC